jgi:hypothetical protein
MCKQPTFTLLRAVVGRFWQQEFKPLGKKEERGGRIQQGLKAWRSSQEDPKTIEPRNLF